jgi:hypothetical protein
MGAHSSQTEPVAIGYDTLQGKCMANRDVAEKAWNKKKNGKKEITQFVIFYKHFVT